MENKHPFFSRHPIPGSQGDPVADMTGANRTLPPETRPQVTEAEHKLLRAYSKEVNQHDPMFGNKSFRELNKWLRSPEAEDHPQFRAIHKALSTVFSRAPRMSTPVHVFRHITIPAAYGKADIQRVFDAFSSAKGTGRAIRIPGYQSTSTDQDAWPWLEGKRSIGMHIIAKHGLDLSPHGDPNERELLLPHNSKYRVHDVKQTKGEDEPGFVVHLEQHV